MTELAVSTIIAQTLHPRDLPRAQREECHQLLAEHFAGVSFDQFQSDLAEKNVILMLRDGASGRMTGFSTMRVYETSVAGSPISVVCSGDTIVDPSAWNSPALPREWIAAVNRLRSEYPHGPYYWLLITSGFRTYRLLSTFWESFYPQADSGTDDSKRLLNALASERFGRFYDPTNGIVRFDRPQLLRPHLAGIPPQRLSDRHVAFFAAKNPGHVQGDELACLCDLDASNLTRAGRRMVFGAGRGGEVKFLPAAANLAWWATCEPAHGAFRSALHDPRRAQEQILRRCIATNADTQFGREHHFAQIDSVADFRRCVPMRSYDQLTPWIDRIAARQEKVLTAEPVQRLLPTSGSTRAKKLIPFTASLQRQLNYAISPWIADLFRSDPALVGGCAYWSITPPSPATTDSDAFDEDTAYLGGGRKRLVDAILAVPADAVRHLRDIDTFRHVTMKHLLRRADLRLISVWHPSFLELLLDYAEAHWEELCAEIEAEEDRKNLRTGARYERCSAATSGASRAAYLRRVGNGNYPAIWRDLALISCWSDASATGAAQALSRRFPHVRMQPKGLLATEAFVTIPFQNAHPLAVRSHFVEFLDEDGERPRLVDELRAGATYGLIVTTAGGLYRYRLGDRVQVEGFIGRTPSLRLVGREDRVVDRFGEKLSDGFVAQAIQRTLNDFEIASPFAMLAPEGNRYTLYVQLNDTPPPPELSRRLDEALRQNPHYTWCRSLGQLAPPGVFVIRAPAYPVYAAALSASGMRLGDIKPPALSDRADWSSRFGEMAEAVCM